MSSLLQHLYEAHRVENEQRGQTADSVPARDGRDTLICCLRGNGVTLNATEKYNGGCLDKVERFLITRTGYC